MCLSGLGPTFSLTIRQSGLKCDGFRKHEDPLAKNASLIIDLERLGAKPSSLRVNLLLQRNYSLPPEGSLTTFLILSVVTYRVLNYNIRKRLIILKS
jgi:hypothetical protein